jgi:CRISPR system Cascade subunit CasB
MADTTRLSFEERFVQALAAMAERDDRAALAALRRGLGKPPGTAPETFPHVVPNLPPDPSPRLERAYYLVASLFALHPVHWERPAGDRTVTDLGASFGLLAQRSSNSAGVERRFLHLLLAHEEELPGHLRHIIGLFKAHEVPVDWVRLLRDLPRWDHEDRTVQRRWARSYYESVASGEEESGSES